MISRLVLLLWGVTADVVLRGDLPLSVNDIGLGYSLIYGNPQGLHFKTGGEDPGLLLTRHVLDIGKFLTTVRCMTSVSDNSHLCVYNHFQ